MPRKTTRIERDSMGSMQVPASAYYGASTQRAVLNFPISNLRLPRTFIQALAYIKHGAAEFNREHGLLPRKLANAIKRAALEVADGKFDSQFVVDVFQTGSGTSTNMNMNEVIANRAIELLGGKRGDRSLVHPNDHVNAGMSSNDAIPTATHLAAVTLFEKRLAPSLALLDRALGTKSRQFAGVIKTGRTHLQDATPITLGQEFSGYAAQIANARARATIAAISLRAVALGGTAVGTGVNTRADFAAKVLALVSKVSGVHVQETDNHFQAQSTLDDVVAFSGVLRSLAVSLTKIGNDIRWLGSGPRAGLGELQLPEVQPGSSIMPGKVNPVIVESLLQVCAQVIGNDATIAFAGSTGNFELNVMQPVAAFNLLQSIELLANSCDNFRLNCIDALVATDAGPASVERGLALCTALVPAVGYDVAAAVSKEAAKTNRTIREVAAQTTTLGEPELTALLDPFRMTTPDPIPPAKLTRKQRLGKRNSSPASPLVIGITGGIACGKNVVATELSLYGVLVIDTDTLGHELLQSPNEAYDAVVKRFGADLVSAPGAPIDRKKLGALVFQDAQALSGLNAIMHPAIRKLLDERIAAATDYKVIAVMVPLLFEGGMEERFHEIWTITVEESVQLARLMKRNGLTEEEARKRIAAQWPQAEKAKRSDRVINNSGTIAQTKVKASRCLEWSKRRFKVS